MKETTFDILTKVIKHYCILENYEFETFDYKDWARIERLYNSYLEGKIEL